MSDYQNRVHAELSELTQKRAALHALLVDQPRIERLGIDAAELARLRRQHTYMMLYENVLAERIAAFA